MTPVRYHTGHFPPENLDWQRLLPMIGPAHTAIAGYEVMMKGLPDANVLLSPLASQEAVLLQPHHRYAVNSNRNSYI